MEKTENVSGENGAHDNKAEVVRQLTQKQYELSTELADGIERLQKVIQETEKYTCKAKDKYQE